MVQEELISDIENSIKRSSIKPAFIPFIVAGHPNIDITKKLLKLFEEKKAAAIEIGIPFSDPLADGPVIQKASKVSLENGMNINKIFEMLEEIKNDFCVPLILFTNYNPVLNYGEEEFVKKAASVNVSGLIIPDLPPEEATVILKSCKEHNIDFTLLVTPTSEPERIKKIAELSSGFVYLVSSTGVTGVRDTFSDKLGNILNELKKTAKIPVGVGFGISKPEHIQELKTLGADAVIIGSAIVKLIEEYKNNESFLLDKVGNHIDKLFLSGN